MNTHQEVASHSLSIAGKKVAVRDAGRKFKIKVLILAGLAGVYSLISCKDIHNIR